MNYAMEIAAQGALTSLYRADVLSNNLANFETPGFKADMPVLRHRDVARVEDGLGYLPSNALLERLGAGPHLAPNYVDFTPGALDVTDRPLDVAIEGDGFFLVASGHDDALGLSRDGRLTIDDRGRLVQSASGHRILDDRQRPIFVSIEDGPIEVASDGIITQGLGEIGRMALVDLPDRRALAKNGAGSFSMAHGSEDSLVRATGKLRQGAVESAGVNEISTLNDLTGALSAVGTNIGMMTYADRMLDLAINRLGRVG
jgi:flagellar basal body rod protein FlgG